jgi:hypothetical protein
MSRRAPLALLLILLAAVQAVPASADTVLTLKSRIDGLRIPGQPAETESRLWLAGDKLRRDDGETSVILRLDRNKLYLVNHADQTYNELSFPIDPQQFAVAGPAADAMKVVARVTPTNEVKKIRDWSARKIRVEISNAAGVKLDTTMWMSPDLDSGGAFRKLAVSLAALQPGNADWARKLEQIEGFPVLQEADVQMGDTRFKTREELVAVEAKDAPAGFYEPPAGYAVRPFTLPG